MNRAERRRAAARQPQVAEYGDLISAAADYIANVAGPTATGATVVMPNGEVRYMSLAEAITIAAGKTTGPKQ